MAAEIGMLGMRIKNNSPTTLKPYDRVISNLLINFSFGCLYLFYNFYL